MIRKEAEYREAVERLTTERNRLGEHRQRLRAADLSDDEVKCVTDPMESFHLQLVRARGPKSRACATIRDPGRRQQKRR